MPTERDARLADAVIGWFAESARDLPWRRVGADGRRDPYLSLVSEFMLQQTQVSRVLEKFAPFVERFPTVGALASSDEHDVLAEWSGLGYYRRAKHLHGASKAIVERFDGRVPSDVESLATIPGIGRYTAGAIASMVFHEREPLVDGNVVRVLMRLDARDGAAGDRDNHAWAWERATDLVEAAGEPDGGRVALLNEGLMELGALVCTPKAPRCLHCPLSEHCEALRGGRQDEIPRASARAKRKPLYCASVIVRDSAGRVLLERRADTGLWAGLWQTPTVEREDRPAKAEELASILRQNYNDDAGGFAGAFASIGVFAHATTHRDVRFEVWRYDGEIGEIGDRRWVSSDELASFGVSNAQRKVLALDVVP
jgi:A/G-specific adenine glycosylase